VGASFEYVDGAVSQMADCFTKWKDPDMVWPKPMNAAY